MSLIDTPRAWKSILNGGVLKQILRVLLQGGDGTDIGNVGDQLKVRSTHKPESLTAFGRFKTSIPTILFEGNFIENERVDLFDQEVIGGATISRDTNLAQMDLTCGTASGDMATVQSFRNIKYTPGQSDSVVLVQKFVQKVNHIQRVGLLNDNNGLFFYLNESTFGVGVRTSTGGAPAETLIPQADFSIDKLDGTGPSGTTIDLTKVQIFYIDFQWLGAGTVRFGFFNDGELIFFHERHHANISSLTKYMKGASLPIRWQCENLAATASSTTLEASCCSIISEGLVNAPVQRRSYTTENEVALPADGTFIHVISIRIKSTSEFGNIKPILFDILAATPDAMLARLLLDSTIIGGTWISVDANSVSEYNETATGFTGGTIIAEKLIGQQAESVLSTSEVDVFAGKFIDGTSQILTIVARTLNNNANVHGGISWEEIY